MTTTIMNSWAQAYIDVLAAYPSLSDIVSGLTSPGGEFEIASSAQAADIQTILVEAGYLVVIEDHVDFSIMKFIGLDMVSTRYLCIQSEGPEEIYVGFLDENF